MEPMSIDEINKLQQENEAYKQSEQEAQKIIAELKEKCKKLSKKYLDADAKAFQYQYALQCADRENEKLKQTLQQIKEIANNIVYSDEIPACVNDKECPLNGGEGFDNHCNMRCPFILGKQIIDLIQAEGGNE